jgi:hypothetical protein
MGLAALGSERLAELPEVLLRAAVGDHPLDRRHRFANAQDLALGLPAAAEDAQAARPLTCEVLRRDRARSTGPELAQLVGLDHRGELGAVEVEQADHEGGAARKPGV